MRANRSGAPLSNLGLQEDLTDHILFSFLLIHGYRASNFCSETAPGFCTQNYIIKIPINVNLIHLAYVIYFCQSLVPYSLGEPGTAVDKPHEMIYMMTIIMTIIYDVDYIYTRDVVM